MLDYVIAAMGSKFAFSTFAFFFLALNVLQISAFINEFFTDSELNLQKSTDCRFQHVERTDRNEISICLHATSAQRVSWSTVNAPNLINFTFVIHFEIQNYQLNLKQFAFYIKCNEQLGFNCYFYNFKHLTWTLSDVVSNKNDGNFSFLFLKVSFWYSCMQCSYRIWSKFLTVSEIPCYTNGSFQLFYG